MSASRDHRRSAKESITERNEKGGREQPGRQLMFIESTLDVIEKNKRWGGVAAG